MGNLAKLKNGYGYKYADLGQTNEYLESIGVRYYQYIEPIEGVDYIYTVPIIDGKELPPRRGCRVVQAPLGGKSNIAQEQGSGITYARRYSLWLAFGLATEDDDAKAYDRKPESVGEVKTRLLKFVNDNDVKVDAVLNKFKVNDLNDMNVEQMRDCIKWLEECKKLKGGN